MLGEMLFFKIKKKKKKNCGTTRHQQEKLPQFVYRAKSSNMLNRGSQKIKVQLLINYIPNPTGRGL